MVTLKISVTPYNMSVRDILEVYAKAADDVKNIYPDIPINVEVSVKDPFQLIGSVG